MKVIIVNKRMCEENTDKLTKRLKIEKTLKKKVDNILTNLEVANARETKSDKISPHLNPKISQLTLIDSRKEIESKLNFLQTKPKVASKENAEFQETKYEISERESESEYSCNFPNKMERNAISSEIREEIVETNAHDGLHDTTSDDISKCELEEERFDNEIIEYDGNYESEEIEIVLENENVDNYVSEEKVLMNLKSDEIDTSNRFTNETEGTKSDEEEEEEVTMLEVESNENARFNETKSEDSDSVLNVVEKEEEKNLETKSEDSEEIEEEIEVVNIDGKSYYTNDNQNGLIFIILTDEDIGVSVGKFVKGVATFDSK